jgi:hypothetical protein
MNHRYLRAIFLSLFLCCYLGVAACGTTSGPVKAVDPSSFTPQKTDPMFWDMWEDEHGLG